MSQLPFVPISIDVIPNLVEKPRELQLFPFKRIEDIFQLQSRSVRLAYLLAQPVVITGQEPKPFLELLISTSREFLGGKNSKNGILLKDKFIEMFSDDSITFEAFRSFHDWDHKFKLETPTLTEPFSRVLDISSPRFHEKKLSDHLNARRDLDRMIFDLLTEMKEMKSTLTSSFPSQTDPLDVNFTTQIIRNRKQFFFGGCVALSLGLDLILGSTELPDKKSFRHKNKNTSSSTSSFVSSRSALISSTFSSATPINTSPTTTTTSSSLLFSLPVAHPLSTLPSTPPLPQPFTNSSSSLSTTLPKKRTNKRQVKKQHEEKEDDDDDDEEDKEEESSSNKQMKINLHSTPFFPSISLPPIPPSSTSSSSSSEEEED